MLPRALEVTTRSTRASLQCTHLEHVVDLHEATNPHQRGRHHRHHQAAGRVELGPGQGGHRVAEVLQRCVLDVFGDAQNASIDEVLHILPTQQSS